MDSNRSNVIVWYRIKGWVSDAAVLCAIALASGFFVLPALWIADASFKSENALFSGAAANYTLENYTRIFADGFGRFLINSLGMCLIATAISTVIAIMAAYVFSRMRFRGKKLAFGSVLIGQMFPWVILVTPLFIMFARIGALNTYGTMIFIYVALSLPFSIYLLVGYLESVPSEIDEAAMMDGCPRFWIIWKIIFPIIVPGVVATATYSFLLMWQEFLFALAVLTENQLKTLPLGISQYFGTDSVSWGAVLAASVVTTVPALILFIPLQAKLAQGLTAGAVKG